MYLSYYEWFHFKLPSLGRNENSVENVFPSQNEETSVSAMFKSLLIRFLGFSVWFVLFLSHPVCISLSIRPLLNNRVKEMKVCKVVLKLWPKRNKNNQSPRALMLHQMKPKLFHPALV